MILFKRIEKLAMITILEDQMFQTQNTKKGIDFFSRAL